MDWKQEILSRLDLIANKLGVAAGHLWVILVRQAYVEGLAGLIGGLLGIVFLVFATIIIRKYYSYPTQVEVKYFEGSKELKKFVSRQEEHGSPLVLAGILIFAGLLCVFILGVDGLEHVLNPEFYALQKIVETVK